MTSLTAHLRNAHSPEQAIQAIGEAAVPYLSAEKLRALRLAKNLEDLQRDAASLQRRIAHHVEDAEEIHLAECVEHILKAEQHLNEAREGLAK